MFLFSRFFEFLFSGSKLLVFLLFNDSSSTYLTLILETWGFIKVDKINTAVGPEWEWHKRVIEEILQTWGRCIIKWLNSKVPAYTYPRSESWLMISNINKLLETQNRYKHIFTPAFRNLVNAWFGLLSNNDFQICGSYTHIVTVVFVNRCQQHMLHKITMN